MAQERMAQLPEIWVSCDPLGLHFLPGVDTQHLQHTIRLTVVMMRLTLSFKIHKVHAYRNYSTTRPVIAMQSCLSASQKSDMLANKHENLGGPQCYFFRK